MDRDAIEQIVGAKLPLPPRHFGEGFTHWVDLVTLLTVLSGAALWGLVALRVVTVDMGWPMRAIYGFIGLSAIWQWSRQRF